jgi:hypothetical protein
LGILQILISLGANCRTHFFSGESHTSILVVSALSGFEYDRLYHFSMVGSGIQSQQFLPHQMAHQRV